jgi:two-component system CheB/CheR fusion protein
VRALQREGRNRAAEERSQPRSDSPQAGADSSREYLQSVIEQQEAAYEELQSANEEVQSANEELQSINEELETSREEIQSANEELASVNEELSARNSELAETTDDLLNLLSSVQISIIMLGPDLRIRRFTPTAERRINLLPTDVGRPIGDINLNIDLPDLEALVTEVMESMIRCSERCGTGRPLVLGPDPSLQDERQPDRGSGAGLWSTSIP